MNARAAVLPLKKLVLYPSVVSIPLTVGRPGALLALDFAQSHRSGTPPENDGANRWLSKVVLLPQLDEAASSFNSTNLAKIGTLGHLEMVIRGGASDSQGPWAKLMVIGESRVRIDAITDNNGMLMAEVSFVGSFSGSKSEDIDKMVRDTAALFRNYVLSRGLLTGPNAAFGFDWDADVILGEIKRPQSISDLTDLMSTFIDCPKSEKLSLLLEVDAYKRLEYLHRFLSEQG